MKKSIHILALIVLSVFGVQGLAEEVPVIFTDRVELSTYSDAKSILVDWSAPEDVKVDKITIYRAEDYTSAFIDRKSTRLNSSHTDISRMPSSA